MPPGGKHLGDVTNILLEVAVHACQLLKSSALFNFTACKCRAGQSGIVSTFHEIMNLKMKWFSVYFLVFSTNCVICLVDGECHHRCLAETALRDKCLLKEIDGKCYYLFASVTDWQKNYDLCERQQLEMVRFSNESFSHMVLLKTTDPDFRIIPKRTRKSMGRWLAGKSQKISKPAGLGIKMESKYIMAVY